MVNIAGKSRGCSTCRRRRVKCDESRPICNRCKRCGFECSGVKDITFIDQRRASKSGGARKRTTILIPPGVEDRKWISGPSSFSLKGFEIQIYICYTKKYLLRDGPVNLALQEFQLNDICSAGKSTGDAQLLHRTILSLAIIFFGHQHGSPSIQNYGYVVHGIALKQLNYTLPDPKSYLRDDVLLSVVTFVLLECFVPTGRRYYLKHVLGLEKLLELRGPNIHCSPKDFGIYKSVSRMIILASLSMRKPTILAREEWKSIPWINCSDEEMAEQYLFNVLAEFTVLVSEHDRVIASCELDDENVTNWRNEVTRRALDLLDQLHLWKGRRDSNDWNFHFETTAAYEMDDVSFPTLSVLNNSMVTMLMLYNTALIYVLHLLASLSPRPLGDPQQVSGEYAAAERSAALEIYQCVPYYLAQKSDLDAGSLTVAHLAVRTAWLTHVKGNDASGDGWMTDLLITKGNEVFAKGIWVD